ncbi:MAG: N-acetyl-gamma-glutamyl-phosphate reductase [Planctomycetota bacterium]
MTHRVAIAGATGYTGLELIELVLAHPEFELAGVFGSPGGGHGGRPVGEVFGRLHGRTDLAIEDGTPDAILACRPSVVFLCTPHEASAALAPALLDGVEIVADLSGAFRLPDPADYPRHYGFEHPAPDLLREAAYGLPELDPAGLRDARLIACPGCYPTASLLPMRPLLDAGVVEADWTPLIDAVSGISGAGRAASPRTAFGEVSLQPYNVLAHRHQPEISTHAGRGVLFTPSVAPFFRGMLSVVHLRLAEAMDAANVRGVLASAYADRPFVRMLPHRAWPAVLGVERTNFADIGVAVDDSGTHAVVACAIDNLLKGASGQALQAVNVRLGLPETLGLLPATGAHAAGGSP